MREKQETVVLVHGLGGSRLDMWPIARRLKRSGFDVRNWGYVSIGNRIESHAQRLGQRLARLESELSGNRIHLVTHSMGGIIASTMFAKCKFNHVGRVVMLAPPHRGSHMARKLTPFIGWVTPSLGQLSDDPASFVNNLPNSLQQNGIEFGIVEASKDRVIASGFVHLDGHRDIAQVTGHHGILTWYSSTIDLVERFLDHGCFQSTTTQASDELPTAGKTCQSAPFDNHSAVCLTK